MTRQVVVSNNTISLNLGFFPSVVLFASVIAIPAVGWWRFNMNPLALIVFIALIAYVALTKLDVQGELRATPDSGEHVAPHPHPRPRPILDPEFD